MYQNDLPMSLKSDTFNALCSDFDDVLRSTLRGMVETDQDNAEINVKVKISLTEGSAPDYTVAGGRQTREVTKPKFDHTVSAVIQRKEKKTGSLSGEYELVWDNDSCKYVMRPIDNGQIDLFEDGSAVVDAEYTVADGEGQPGLPEPPQEGADVEEGDYTEDAEGTLREPASESEETSDDTRTPFGWLKQFINTKMKVQEAMGHYTVRTIDNRVVLSSATGEDSPFYCPPEKLEPHVGHEVICVGYGDEEIVNVSIECEDCNEVLFDLDAPDEEEDGDELTDEEIAESVDEAEEAPVEQDAEESGYRYDAPEPEE